MPEFQTVSFNDDWRLISGNISVPDIGSRFRRPESSCYQIFLSTWQHEFCVLERHCVEPFYYPGFFISGLVVDFLEFAHKSLLFGFSYIRNFQWSCFNLISDLCPVLRLQYVHNYLMLHIESGISGNTSLISQTLRCLP